MILVVVGAGYIGSDMVKDLLRDNYEVLTLEDLSKGHRDLVCGGTFTKVGVGDAALLDEIFSTYPIDAVMHFAAHSIVGESVENPLDYYHNNVAATAELLSAMAGQIRPEANTQILSHLINNQRS